MSFPSNINNLARARTSAHSSQSAHNVPKLAADLQGHQTLDSHIESSSNSSSLKAQSTQILSASMASGQLLKDNYLSSIPSHKVFWFLTCNKQTNQTNAVNRTERILTNTSRRPRHYDERFDSLGDRMVPENYLSPLDGLKICFLDPNSYVDLSKQLNSNSAFFSQNASETYSVQTLHETFTNVNQFINGVLTRIIDRPFDGTRLKRYFEFQLKSTAAKEKFPHEYDKNNEWKGKKLPNTVYALFLLFQAALDAIESKTNELKGFAAMNLDLSADEFLNKCSENTVLYNTTLIPKAVHEMYVAYNLKIYVIVLLTAQSFLNHAIEAGFFKKFGRSKETNEIYKNWHLNAKSLLGNLVPFLQENSSSSSSS